MYRDKLHDSLVLDRLIKEIQYVKALNRDNHKDDLWVNNINASLKKIVRDNGVVLKDNIRNFRRFQIFTSESPTYNELFFFNYLNGGYRAQKYYIQDRLALLKAEGSVKYLEKYPIDFIGNPYYLKIDEYKLNERWSRHIHYLYLALKYLGNFLGSGNAKVLDIGGGYGIFSNLLRREFNFITSGVVDFPEQLILTYYYLATNFPEAKINTIKDISEVDSIDKDFVTKYDFLLIPNYCYKKIQKNVFNVITNFNSLSEMSREWFNLYLNSDIFKSASYFFTVNRFEYVSLSDNVVLNILDYPLDCFDKLLFQISPLFSRCYGRKYLFFVKKVYLTSWWFEFIGKRKE